MIEQLTKSGIKLLNYNVGGHKIVCPQCSQNRRNKTDPCLSVTITPENAVWLCHHCQWSGATKDAREPSSAPRVAATPRKIAYEPPQAVSEPIQKWFERRGISAPVVLRNGIGYEQVWMPGCENGTTVGAIMFPFRRDGETINIKYRTHDKRFRQEKGAEKVYYGLDDIKDQHEVIIVEGEIDKLSLEEAGIKNVVSVPDGAPAKVKDGIPEDDRKFEYVWNCKDYFEHATRIVLAVDNDEPGRALAEELARRYGKHRCWRVNWPDSHDIVCKDANEVLTLHGPQTLKECIENAEPYPIKALVEATKYREDVRRLYRGETLPAYSTGWVKLDSLYKVRPGELTVVTGFPGSGKSQFIDALGVNLAEHHGWKLGVCSFENPPANHITKLIELHTRFPFWPGPSARITPDDLEKAIDWLNQRYVFLRAEDESPTIDWILEAARMAVMRYGIKGLVIDPYNEIEHKRQSGQTETEYISELLSKTKRFAQNSGVHVWFIAHPSKPQRFQGEVIEPTLFDISGSAHWVNKADVGIIVVRDYEEGHEKQVTIKIKKVRFKEVGQVGEVVLEYNRANGRYTAT